MNKTMTPEKALLLLMKHTNNPVIGYWKFGSVYVFNTKIDANKNIVEPAQFAVDGDGKVYPTNPLEYDLDTETMIKL